MYVYWLGLANRCLYLRVPGRLTPLLTRRLDVLEFGLMGNGAVIKERFVEGLEGLNHHVALLKGRIDDSQFGSDLRMEIPSVFQERILDPLIKGHWRFELRLGQGGVYLGGFWTKELPKTGRSMVDADGQSAEGLDPLNGAVRKLGSLKCHLHSQEHGSLDIKGSKQALG